MYASPEILLGQNPDEKSDVFSVGLIFYELLLGKLPFKFDNNESLSEYYKKL